MKNLDFGTILVPDNLLPKDFERLGLNDRTAVCRFYAEEGARLAVEAALRMFHHYGLPSTANDLRILFGYEETPTLSERGLEALSTLRDRGPTQFPDFKDAIDIIDGVLAEVEELEKQGVIQVKEVKIQQTPEEVSAKPASLDPTQYPINTWFRRADGFAVKSEYAFVRGLAPGVVALKVGGFLYRSDSLNVLDAAALTAVIAKPVDAPSQSCVWSIGDK